MCSIENLLDKNIRKCNAKKNQFFCPKCIDCKSLGKNNLGLIKNKVRVLVVEL